MNQVPPRPVEDPQRLASLRATGLLDSPPEEVFDRLTRLATLVTNAPVALVSLVDRERQFFKSQHGLAEPWASRRETPLSHSFCQHAVDSGEPLVIEDARGHPLVHDNLATRDLGVIAYLGVPLRTSDGHVLGSFCIVDRKSRAWTDEQVQLVCQLAEAAVREIELRTELAVLQGRHHVEVAAERAQVIKELAIGLRHEINNALMSLMAEAQGLAEARAMAEEHKQAVQVILAQAGRIRHVASRLNQVDQLATTGYVGDATMIDLRSKEATS